MCVRRSDNGVIEQHIGKKHKIHVVGDCFNQSFLDVSCGWSSVGGVFLAWQYTERLAKVLLMQPFDISAAIDHSVVPFNDERGFVFKCAIGDVGSWNANTPSRFHADEFV